MAFTLWHFLLYNLDVNCVKALLALLHFKLNTVVFVDCIDKTALVNKEVITRIAGLNEAETFRSVEKLDYAFFHNYGYLIGFREGGQEAARSAVGFSDGESLISKIARSSKNPRSVG